MSIYARVDLDLDVDLGSIAATEDRVIRRVLTAASRAVQRTTRELEKELEEITRLSVPGKLYKAWTSEVAPKEGRIAREPAGWVRLNSRRFKDGRVTRSYGAMDFYSSAGMIRGKRGQYLAIPTKAAGSRGRSRNLTPRDWEQATGQKLRLIKSQERGGGGRVGLLVADQGTTNGRSGAFRPITRGRTKADERRGFLRGAQTVVIFVLVETVPFANTFSTEPAFRRAEARLRGRFDTLLGNDDRRP